MRDIAQELLRVARELVAARVEDFARFNKEYDIIEVDEDDVERFFDAFNFTVEDLSLTPRSLILWVRGPEGFIGEDQTDPREFIKLRRELKRSRLVKDVDVRVDGYVKIDFKYNAEFV